MEYEESGIHRADFRSYKESGKQNRAHIEPVQPVGIPNPKNNKTKPEDLGRPAMGWMPRDKVMALVQQIHAKQTSDKGR